MLICNFNLVGAYKFAKLLALTTYVLFKFGSIIFREEAWLILLEGKTDGILSITQEHSKKEGVGGGGGGVGKEKRKKKDRVLHIVENTHIYIICKCLKNGGTDPLFYWTMFWRYIIVFFFVRVSYYDIRS